MSTNVGLWNAPASRRTKAFAVLLVCQTLVTLSGAAPPLTVREICDRMREAGSVSGSLTGTEVVSKAYVGVPAPDLGFYASAGYSTEGRYRWYLFGTEWAMVKDVPVPSEEGRRPGINHYVVRSYKGRVLSNTDFEQEGGRSYFLDAHLDSRSERADDGPLAGRRWNGAPIADILKEMTDVRCVRSSRGIELDGKRGDEPLHLTIDPERGYLATELTQRSGDDRYGFTIPKSRRVGSIWMPERMETFNGTYRDGKLTMGSTGTVEFADFAPHGRPTRREVPPIPTGSLLGSEESRLYRMAADGTLLDFGRQGTKPGTSLAWGDVFVLSGAGLLLGTLSWAIFRKRRSPSSPPGVRGRG